MDGVEAATKRGILMLGDPGLRLRCPPCRLNLQLAPQIGAGSATVFKIFLS
jgi:hypothetical protein